MKDLSRQGYTHQEVLDILRMKTGAREVRFRYDLLDENENKKGELYEVESGEINFSAFSDIKRTARFRLREEMDISEVVEELILGLMDDKTLEEMG